MAFSKNSRLPFSIAVLFLLSSMETYKALIDSLISTLGGQFSLKIFHIMNNSINAPRHIIKFTQFFFYRSVENFLSINKFFNIAFKIRGHPIINIVRITIRIAIIIRGISRKRSIIEITPISVVVEIISRDKIHINSIIILLNQGRQWHIIRINMSIFTSNQLQ